MKFWILTLCALTFGSTLYMRSQIDSTKESVQKIEANHEKEVSRLRSEIRFWRIEAYENWKAQAMAMGADVALLDGFGSYVKQVGGRYE